MRRFNGDLWVCSGQHDRSGFDNSRSGAEGGRVHSHPGRKKSGSSKQDRKELNTLLEFMRAGDSLVVTRVDRLARSVGDLQDIVRLLKQKGVTLKATEQPIDTSSAAGEAFLDMLGVFAEFETNLRRERQMEGIAAGKKQRGLQRQEAPC